MKGVNKVKVFISQPMRDRESEEIIAERKEIERYLNIRYDNKVEVIDSYITNFNEVHSNLPIVFVGIAVQKMADADLVVFADNWQTARGCRVERKVAEEYGLEILDF